MVRQYCLLTPRTAQSSPACVRGGFLSCIVAPHMGKIKTLILLLALCLASITLYIVAVGLLAVTKPSDTSIVFGNNEFSDVGDGTGINRLPIAHWIKTEIYGYGETTI